MKTVFVLEDEKNIREALEILLSFENCQVISCTNVSDFMNYHQQSFQTFFFLTSCCRTDQEWKYVIM